MDKKIEEILINKILYIGNEIPYFFTTDKRNKQLYLGYPQELIDELKTLFSSEQEKLMDKIIGNESKYLDSRKLTELEKNYYLGRANLRSEQRARYKEIKK